MPMSAEPAWPSRLERVPMPLEEYLGLGERPKAEYVDGTAIVTPPATAGHNRVQRHLAHLIEQALPPERDVRTDAGLRHDGRYRVPDIAVFERRDPEVVWSDDVPLLVVEVISPSTASEDTVRKSVEYLRAGIAHYWLVDRPNRVLVAFDNVGDGWELVLRLDDDLPAGEVEVTGHGTVPLDVRALLDA